MAGVYVHIPFCHSKCAYCDFFSVANPGKIAAFTEALKKEWLVRCLELGNEIINTIYFGGGTPSILSPEAFSSLSSLFPTQDVEEFTIEVNPEDVTPLNVCTWRMAGVNRVSMGIQSLVDSELKTVGRRHSASEAIDAIRCLKENGIYNISCDLIYGLPGQTCDSWSFSLQRLLKQGIQHLSAYCLSYEPGTRLYMKRERGELTETDDAVLEKMYNILCRTAHDAGMVHYEISNFSFPDMYSRHNSSYWNLTPYLGLGPGAHSLGTDGKRRFNPPLLSDYIASPDVFTRTEEEDERDRFNDMLLISLRTAHGLPLSLIPEEFLSQTVRSAEPFLASGYLKEENGAFIIPEEKWIVADSVIRELFID